jgi:hypothetical protein
MNANNPPPVMTINPSALLNSTASGHAASGNQQSTYLGQTMDMRHPPGFSHPTEEVTRSQEIAARSSAAVIPGRSEQRQIYSGASPLPSRASGRTHHSARGASTVPRSELNIQAATVRHWQQRYHDGGYFVYRSVRTSTIKAALRAPYDIVLPGKISEFINTAISKNRVPTCIYLFLLLSRLLYRAKAFVT